MPLVRANGLQFNTCRLGSGPPLVMLHGLLLGNLATWYFSSAPTLAKTHEVLLYDLRGHGRSERVTSGYDIETMTRDLHSLIHDLSEPVVLVGHSYGALIALQYTLNYPDAVCKLALIEAPLPPGSFSEITEFLSQTPEHMLEAVPEAVSESVQRSGRRARKMLGALHFLAAETSLLADVSVEPDISDDRLRSVSCPVLSVYGDTSQCRSVGERFSRVMPNCEHQVVHGGHFLPVENPAAVSTALEQFVNG